ncbi:MAG: hypothetical protein C0502_01505 [Opitutus sp.]|nr:hypothetical protein [Opitutus sp.]
MKPRPRSLLLATACLWLGGCYNLPSKPKPPAVDPAAYAASYDNDTFEADRKTYLKLLYDGKVNEATVRRDVMINRIRVDIDAWYSQYEADLSDHRAKFNTWSDVGELLLSGAATLTNGERAKTVLAAILTAGKGARQSYDKNRFREKATEMLMSTMRAERTRLLLGINAKMTAGNARQYTFEEAWGDLIAYCQAGTMEGALTALVSQTGAEAQAAKTKAAEQDQERAERLQNAPEANIILRTWITQNLANLDQGGAKAVLDGLKIDIPATPPADLRELIRDHQESIAADDEKGLKQLATLIKKFGGQP